MNELIELADLTYFLSAYKLIVALLLLNIIIANKVDLDLK